MMQRLVALRWNLIIASTVLFTATSILCAISSAGSPQRVSGASRRSAWSRPSWGP